MILTVVANNQYVHRFFTFLVITLAVNLPKNSWARASRSPSSIPQAQIAQQFQGWEYSTASSDAYCSGNLDIPRNKIARKFVLLFGGSTDRNKITSSHLRIDTKSQSSADKLDKAAVAFAYLNESAGTSKVCILAEEFEKSKNGNFDLSAGFNKNLAIDLMSELLAELSPTH